MDEKQFIELVKDGAIKAFNKYKVLPSLTLAQAILESNYGQSGLSKRCFNLFGIKWKEGCGYDFEEFDTKECYRGEWTTVKARFRKYKSYDESIEDHAVFLTKTRYKPVLIAKDYKEAAIQVQKCGYATDPKYSDKLISLIEKYSLNQYDKVGLSLEEAIDIWSGKEIAAGRKVIGNPGDMKHEFEVKKLTPSRFEALLMKSATYVKGNVTDLSSAVDAWNTLGVIGNPSDMKKEFREGVLSVSRMKSFLVKSAAYVSK
ncbi:MAG: glycoside hydrolase family 73 protein [Clostridia bacterium]|nr:glycoside hydrolase family 73 protein [Clostridia bacterium]